jgi:hypothetical protein
MMDAHEGHVKFEVAAGEQALPVEVYPLWRVDQRAFLSNGQLSN